MGCFYPGEILLKQGVGLIESKTKWCITHLCTVLKIQKTMETMIGLGSDKNSRKTTKAQWTITNKETHLSPLSAVPRTIFGSKVVA